MELRVLPAFVLFLGSYFPLSLILLIQDVPESYWHMPVCLRLDKTTCSLPQLAHPLQSLSLFLACLLSVLLFVTFLRALPAKDELKVVDAKAVPNDLINYVFPYVVTLIGTDAGSVGKFIGLLVFMLWMFWITYKSGQILMNPLLLAAGWQLYEMNVTIKGQAQCVKAISSRKRIKPQETLRSCLVQGIHVLHRGGTE